MKRLACLIQLVALFFFAPSYVCAIATGEGDLYLSAGIELDANSVEWFRGPSSLETWTIGQILSYPNGGGADFHFAEMEDVYGDANIPGWDSEPLPLYGAYGANIVSINNDHSTILNPTAINHNEFNSNAFSDVTQGSTYTNTMYFANLHTTAAGSFTFYVDYGGSWTGETTSIDDWLNMGAELQMSATEILYPETGGYEWGSRISAVPVNEKVFLEDIEAGVIEDFAGRISLTVDYEADQYFNLRFDGVNRISGFSETQDTAPVPEPSTWLLLGTGLAGLAVYRRKRK